MPKLKPGRAAGSPDPAEDVLTPGEEKLLFKLRSMPRRLEANNSATSRAYAAFSAWSSGLPLSCTAETTSRLRYASGVNRRAAPPRHCSMEHYLGVGKEAPSSECLREVGIIFLKWSFIIRSSKLDGSTQKRAFTGLECVEFSALQTHDEKDQDHKAQCCNVHT